MAPGNTKCLLYFTFRFPLFPAPNPFFPANDCADKVESMEKGRMIMRPLNYFELLNYFKL
jgi:hypothetical protein